MIPPVRLKRTFRRATRQAHVIERCFEMNTEYERGRPGVRAHFMSGDVISDLVTARLTADACVVQTRCSSSLTIFCRSSELRSERSMRSCAVLRTSDDVSALQKPIVSLSCWRASFRTRRASSNVSSFEGLVSRIDAGGFCMKSLSGVSWTRPKSKFEARADWVRTGESGFR